MLCRVFIAAPHAAAAREVRGRLVETHLFQARPCMLPENHLKTIKHVFCDSHTRIDKINTKLKYSLYEFVKSLLTIRNTYSPEPYFSKLGSLVYKTVTCSVASRCNNQPMTVLCCKFLILKPNLYFKLCRRVDRYFISREPDGALLCMDVKNKDSLNM